MIMQAAKSVTVTSVTVSKCCVFVYCNANGAEDWPNQYTKPEAKMPEDSTIK